MAGPRMPSSYLFGIRLPGGSAAGATVPVADQSARGGYRSEVTVTDTGDVPMLGWMVGWTQPDGRR